MGRRRERDRVREAGAVERGVVGLRVHEHELGAVERQVALSGMGEAILKLAGAGVGASA